MAYGKIGNSPIDRLLTDNSGWTYLDLNVVGQIRGILKSIEVYVAIAVSGLKIKIFRDDGTNYVFIAETAAIALGVELQTIPVWIPVEKGDLIGWFHSAGALDWTDTGGVAKYYTTPGDVTITTLKTAWSNTTVITSVEGKIFTRVAPL